MDFGVTITSGARPWQIFQQSEDGTAAIHLKGRCSRVRLSQELPLSFQRITDRPVTAVKVRVALEETGEDIIPWTMCRFSDESWEADLSGVPAGGPYRIETYMEYEGWDGLSCTRGDMVHHIGVGDIYVIAGQSNAAGRAKGPVADMPDLNVHVLRSSGEWDLATHPLGETTAAVHVGHYENHNPGHSPWLHFAKRLSRELGYPIGLVPCAYGGAPLRWWNPEENGALLRNMMEMLEDGAVRPRAVLWVQGEAEGFEDSAETYLQRFSSFVCAVRRELNDPGLPFVTVQINRCMTEGNEKLDRQWGMVREAQRRAWHTLENVLLVPSEDVALYDFIHNSAQGNLVIGERCARAVLAEYFGKRYDWKAPEIESAVKTAPDTVRIRFSRIRNWLNPYDVTADRLPIEAEDGEGLMRPISYQTGRDTLTLTFGRPLRGSARVHGMWRMDPGPAVPCDCMRLPVLAWYDFPVSEA